MELQQKYILYVQSKLHNHQKTCMENACFFFNSGADRHFGLVLIYPEIRGSGRRKTIDYVYAAGDDGGCGGGGGDCFFLALYHPNLPKTISWWEDAYWRQDSLWLLCWRNSDSCVWGPRATVAEAPFLCRIRWRRVMPRGTLGCFRWCQTSTIREASNQTKWNSDWKYQNILLTALPKHFEHVGIGLPVFCVKFDSPRGQSASSQGYYRFNMFQLCTSQIWYAVWRVEQRFGMSLADSGCWIWMVIWLSPPRFRRHPGMNRWSSLPSGKWMTWSEWKEWILDGMYPATWSSSIFMLGRFKRNIFCSYFLQHHVYQLAGSGTVQSKSFQHKKCRFFVESEDWC